MSTYPRESTSTLSPVACKGGLFRTVEGRNLAVTFVLITSLFLLWGFCNGMIDILNKHFQDTLRITKEQSGLVQAANYLAYFLMAIPAGLIAKRFGYKGGILVGLSLIAAGAFWFIPATSIGTYWAFLLGLFVIAAGMTARGRPYAPQHCSNDQRRGLDPRPDCRRTLCFLRRRRSECQRRPFHSVHGGWHFCGFAARHLRHVVCSGFAQRG